MDLAVFKLDFMTAGLGHGNQMGKAWESYESYVQGLHRDERLYPNNRVIYIYNIMIRNDSGTC
jgi:hypothetical protein